MKRCLLTRYLLSELERSIHPSNANFGPKNVDEVAELIKFNCEQTEVIVFYEIDRDEERKPQVRAINSIKSYHSFTYQDGKCFAKERTNYAGIVEFSFY